MNRWIKRGVALVVASLFILHPAHSEKFVFYNAENSFLPPAAVWDLLFDRNGNLVIGTGKGLIFLSEKEVRIFTPKNTHEKLKKDSVVKVFQDSKGRYWFATRSSFIGGGGLTIFDGKNWKLLTHKNTKGKLPSDFVWDIVEDKEKNIWLATDKGVVKIKNDKWITYNKINTGLGLPGNSVWDIFLDKEGNLWFATNKGVGWFNGKEWRNLTKFNSPIKQENVSAVFQDSKGRCWFGFHSGMFGGGGIVLYDGKKWIFYDKNNTNGGIPHNDINVIFEDSKNIIWIGTRGGVTSYRNGKFTPYLVGKRIWDIEEGPDGNLYFATSRGIAILIRTNKIYPLKWRKP